MSQLQSQFPSINSGPDLSIHADRFENATGSAALSTTLAGSGFSVIADGTICH